MSDPVQAILAALREHGHTPRKSGTGWTCRCPAHEDRTPSLSIGTGDDGRALVRCHAGCASEAVCAAVGLRLSDLFTDDPHRRNGHTPPPTPRRRTDTDETPRSPGSRVGFVGVGGDTDGGDEPPAFPTAREAVAAMEARNGPRSAAWYYRNAKGEPVGVVLRWDKPGGGKSIRPVSLTPRGWVCCGMPEPRPLYRLPELLAADPRETVYVVEGEKAADALRALGLLATTSPHGSKSAGKADWSPLAGRHVVIFPDRDEPGEDYAAQVARLAHAAGALSVRVVRLSDRWPDLPEGGDVADLVERTGGDADALAELALEVAVLADAAEPERPKPAEAESDGYRPFPVHVLPEPLRSFVAETAAAIGCDPSYVAMPVLAALASAVGNARRLELKPGAWIEPAIIWTAIVGESGTTKSPALEAALKPIRDRQHAAMERYAAERADHEAATAIYERAAAEWKRGKSQSPPPTKPDEPKPDRYWTDDATTEAVALLLRDNPRGLLLARDELAGWTASFDRYAGGKGGGDAAKWLEVFGGRPLMVDRKKDGVLYVPRASVSIAGGIQPATLRRALGREHRDNGLAARLLLAWPPFRPALWTEATPAPATVAALSLAFDRLYLLSPGADGSPVLLTLDPEAKAAWIAFHDDHAQEQGRRSGDDAAAWSKLKGYAARLALVLHLARRAGGDRTADPERVDVASILAGVELVRWFGHEARRVYAMMGESDEDADARALAEWIGRRGGVASVRDLTRHLHRFKNKNAEARDALADLVVRGVAEWDHEGPGRKGGRPPERVRLVRREPRDTDDTDADETG